MADEDTRDRHDPLEKLPKWPWLLAFIGFGLFAEAANNTIGMFGTVGDAVVAVADWVTPFGDGSDGEGGGDGSSAAGPSSTTSPTSEPATTTTGPPRRHGAQDPIAIEGAPVALATDGESVWVVAADGAGGGTLTRLTAAGHPEHVLQLAGEPNDVAYAAGSVFVSLGDLGTVRYDAARLGEEDELTSGEGGETQGRHVGVAAGGDGRVWLLTAGGSTGEVYRIDPATGDVEHVGGLEAQPRRIAASRAGAYVLLGESDVTRLRVAAGGDGGAERDPPVGVGERPTGLAVGHDHVWVTRADGQVTRFGLDLREPIDRAPLDGAGAAGVAVASRHAGADDPWLLDVAGDRAVQVDDRTVVAGEGGAGAAGIEVGGDPVDVVATDDALWIATSSPGQVVRIAPG